MSIVLRMAKAAEVHIKTLEEGLTKMESPRAQHVMASYHAQVPRWIAGAAETITKGYQLDRTTGLGLYLSGFIYPSGKYDLKKLEDEYLAEVERVYAELAARLEACIVRAETFGIKVR